MAAGRHLKIDRSGNSAVRSLIVRSESHIHVHTSSVPSAKRTLRWIGRSGSFKVIHFAIKHRPTRGSISSYNTAGLISEVSEEVAIQIAKNCRRRQPHSHLTPAPRGTPANIRMHHIRISRNIFVADSRPMGLSSFKFVQCAPKDASFFATECVLAVQGHQRSSKVDDFGSNPKRVCDFLLVCHCDYGPILHRFWDTPTFSYLSLIRRPRSPCSLWNFALKLTTRTLESCSDVSPWPWPWA